MVGDPNRIRFGVDNRVDLVDDVHVIEATPDILLRLWFAVVTINLTLAGILLIAAALERKRK